MNYQIVPASAAEFLQVAALDRSFTEVVRGNGRHLAMVFFTLLAGWLVFVLETYFLLPFLGVKVDLATAYVIESVGSMFRLVFFLVPSGIGGQDASFVALFKLFGLPDRTVGVFVLVKRFKEVLWIGIGFLLLALFGRKGEARAVSGDAPVAEDAQ